MGDMALITQAVNWLLIVIHIVFKQNLQEEHARQAFDRFDKNHLGVINALEFRKIMTTIKSHLLTDYVESNLVSVGHLGFYKGQFINFQLQLNESKKRQTPKTKPLKHWREGNFWGGSGCPTCQSFLLFSSLRTVEIDR